MNNDLAVAVAWAAVGAALVGWVLVSLTRQLLQERSAQPPEERSSLWVLIAGGLGAYLFAYLAFGEHLQAPWRLAFAALAVASIPAIRRVVS